VKLKSYENVRLSQIINDYLLNSHVLQIWASVPLKAPIEECESLLFDDNDPHCLKLKEMSEKQKDPWHWWNSMRNLCSHHKKFSPVLELNSKDVPSEEICNRWLGEPLKAVIVPTHIFLTNNKGFPVLSREYQVFLKKLFKLNVQFIISGAVLHKDIIYYYQYMDHLYGSQEQNSVEKFSKGYEDYLQTPLQPLMENLESQTYEVFEKDPIKYSEYQRAVEEALKDRVPEHLKDSVTTVIMVVGAGRGPLVRCSFNAARQVGRKVKMYAVEKNPNAIVTLETLNMEEWDNKVTVVSSDMREYDAPEKADILVSELLGSFGDNELSPECLDGAQKFLKEGGISIPCKYTSFAAPMSSHKLHADVKLTQEVGKLPDTPFEMPYVVRLQNVNVLSEAKKIFEFTHPNRDESIDNSRYIEVDFEIKTSTMVHGFAGYFDTVLYKKIDLSIHPVTYSEGMLSWFPVYLPIKTPIYCEAGTSIKFHIWRRVSRTKVWYEWCVTEPIQTAIHNPGGRSYWIGL
jgi:protein arginine N-methyltransferase 5